MSLSTKIESILFAAPRPMTVKKLAEVVGDSPEAVNAALDQLVNQYNVDDRGIHLLRHASTVQFVTSPLNSKMVTAFLKEEQAGELTRPALETLTIVAYRGPISKIQLDTIRGVNCALILRHLMIKGLVEAKPHKDKFQTTYQVTADFVRFLGLDHISNLPRYDELRGDNLLDQLLNPPATTVASEGQTAPTESSASSS